MTAWANANIRGVNGRLETEKFINYWRAKSGATATKVDWPATWRNWMITAAERAGRPPTGGHRPYQDPDDPAAYDGEL
jgi:hypothetical protein